MVNSIKSQIFFKNRIGSDYEYEINQSIFIKYNNLDNPWVLEITFFFVSFKNKISQSTHVRLEGKLLYYHDKITHNWAGMG